MAGLSYAAINALNGGYGPQDKDASAIYGLGRAESTFNLKKLQEQLELEKQQRLLDLVQMGWGSEDQAKNIISDVTGYNLDYPGSQNNKTPTGQMVNYGGLIGYRPKTTTEGTPLQGHINLSGPTSDWSSYDRIAAQKNKILSTPDRLALKDKYAT